MVSQQPNCVEYLDRLTQAIKISQDASLGTDLQKARLTVFGLSDANFENPDESRRWQEYVTQLDELLAIHRR